MALTEKDAAIAYAKAWNCLDCSEFICLFDEDITYASQWVYEEMKGKSAIAEYLVKKFNSVKQSNSKVFAELGITRQSFPRKDCVIMAQGGKNKIYAVVIFEIKNDKVSRFDMVMPEFVDAERTGEYPI